MSEAERRRIGDGAEWATGEIVRNVVNLTSAVDKLNITISHLDAKFVSQERYEADEGTRKEVRAAIESKHKDLAIWVTDLAADQERTKADISKSYGELRDVMVTRTTARWLVGVMVAAMAAAVPLLIAFHH